MNDLKNENLTPELEALIEEARKENEMTPEFREKVYRDLEKTAEKMRRMRKLRMFFATVSAAAAIFLLVIGISSSLPKPEETPDYASTVAQGKPVTIELLFNAKSDLENVKFAISLEDGVNFYSSNNEIRTTKQQSWHGSLKKGENRIPFVVYTEGAGRFSITAQAEYEKFIHRRKILLDAQQKEVAVTMLTLDPIPLD
ncbi:hypothetical protein J5834_04935 [bacterium]|nr:hypothetical protein [bacterium]